MLTERAEAKTSMACLHEPADLGKVPRAVWLECVVAAVSGFSPGLARLPQEDSRATAS